MARRIFDYEDDDDALDAEGILKDGRRVRVPMMFRDATGSSDPRHIGRRPGFGVLRDSQARDAVDAAYWEYEEWVRDAWRTPTGAGGPESHADPSLRGEDARPRDHAQVMDEVYREHDRWLENQWRTTR